MTRTGRVRLLEGCVLVDPALRPAPADVVPQRFDALARAAQDMPWIAACAETHGSDEALDPWLMWAARWPGSSAAAPARIRSRSCAGQSGACSAQPGGARAAAGSSGEDHQSALRGGSRRAGSRRRVPWPLRGASAGEQGVGARDGGPARDAEACLAEAATHSRATRPPTKLLPAQHLGPQPAQAGTTGRAR